MQLIDLTVPLDWNVSVPPRHTPFAFTAIMRIAKGDSSNVSTLPPSPRGGTSVRGGETTVRDGTMRCGTTGIDACVPFRIVGANGAPDVLRKI
jgi:hypothetical protein